jgi:hypothetical protein
MAIESAEETLGLLYPSSNVESTISATEDGTYIDIAIGVTFEPLVGFTPTPSTIDVAAHRVLEFEPDD